MQALAEEQARGIQDAGDVLTSLKNSREVVSGCRLMVSGCRLMSLKYSRESVDSGAPVYLKTPGLLLLI